MSEEKKENVIREKSAMIIKYLQSLDPATEITAKEVSKAIKLTPKQVDGAFTSGVKSKGYGYRKEAQIQDSEGRWINVKYLMLTDEGRNLNWENISIKK